MYLDLYETEMYELQYKINFLMLEMSIVTDYIRTL